MKVLGLDTSTVLGSVALCDGAGLVAEVQARVRATHSESLLDHVDRVLDLAACKPTELELVAFGKGPGSFTGLRIGLATAKGLALGAGIPLVGVSSLLVLAMNAAGARDPVGVVLDARRGEVFVAAYHLRSQAADVVLEPCAAAPEEAGRRLADAMGKGPIVLVGNGLRVYGPVVVAALGDRAIVLPEAYDVPRGAHVARLGLERFRTAGPDDLAAVTPDYLRAPDIREGSSKG